MNYHIYAYNIDWDITEEDLDGCWGSLEELKETLPFDMHFNLAIGADEEDYDVIADHLFDMVGWMPAHFEYSKRLKEDF